MKSSCKFRNYWILMLLFSLTTLQACEGRDSNRKENQQANSKLKIGLITWLGYGPFYVAKEKGFFAENGLDVELIRIEGDAERRAAIASGDLDGIALTLDSMIVLRAGGIPVRTVMVIDQSNGGDGIVATREIKTIEDLAGKEIAFPIGLPSHFFLYSVLDKNGMKMTDIKPVVMGAGAAGAAFAAGQIDVAVTWEPWLSKAKEMSDGHILMDSKRHPGAIEDVLFFREDVIAKVPDSIQSLLEAWFKAVDFVAENPDEAMSIMGKAFDMSVEEVETLLPSIILEGRAGNARAFGSQEEPGDLYALYDRISEAWLDEKVIQRRDDSEEGIDANFVRAAVSQD